LALLPHFSAPTVLMAAVHSAKIRYAQELAAYTLLQWNVALNAAESKGKVGLLL